jgi:HD-GYP domain-containing protein (c-di-GMP phosphodiesterase class II)
MRAPCLLDPVDSLSVGTPLEQRLAEYENLLEIGVELAGTLDLASVLDLALEKAEELCRAETSSIWELDQERGELFFRVVRGTVAGEIRDRRVPLGAGIVGSVAASGRPERVRDVSVDSRWGGDEGSGFVTKAVLAVPLVARGAVVGVLQLLNPCGRSEFSEDDLRRMQLFAGPLANAIENARLYTLLKRQFVDTVTALADAVAKRDPYTGGHVGRVVAYVMLLATEMGLDADELEQLRLAAILHDIGKIAVPDAVLRKPAPLDGEEIEVMQRHPLDGAEIVNRVHELRPLLAGIRHHHERLDGRGYPDGLCGEEIPRMARIIAVADSFDAITTDRPYRQGLTAEQAAGEILEGAGSQYCPTVVEAFRRLFESGRFSVARGEALIASLSPSSQRG